MFWRKPEPVNQTHDLQLQINGLKTMFKDCMSGRHSWVIGYTYEGHANKFERVYCANCEYERERRKCPPSKA